MWKLFINVYFSSNIKLFYSYKQINLNLSIFNICYILLFCCRYNQIIQIVQMFEQISHQHLQSNDFKSRKILTNLLDEQIQRNQLLQAQNINLESEQRKLLYVLQQRTEQIQKLQSTLLQKQKQKQKQLQLSPQKQRQVKQNNRGNNDSTLEMTMIYQNSNQNQINKQIVSLQDKLKKTQTILQEKQTSSKNQREFYVRAMETLDLTTKEQINKLKDKLQQRQNRLKSIEDEHQIFSTKARKQVSQLSKKIIQLQQDEYQKKMISKILEQKQKNIREKDIYIAKLQKQLSSIEALYQEIESKSQTIQQLQKKITNLQIDQTQVVRDIQMLRQKQVEKMKVAHQKEVQKIKTQILGQTKQCILQELQTEQNVFKNQKKMLQEEIHKLKKDHQESLQRNQQQLQLVITLEEKKDQLVLQMQSKISQNQQLRQKIQGKQQQLNEFLKQIKNYQEENERLSQQSSNQSQLLIQKQTMIQRFKIDIKRQEQKSKFIKKELEQLKYKYQVLDQSYKSCLIEKDTKQSQIQRISQKMIKQNERKTKLVNEYKKTFQQFEERINNQQNTIYDLKAQKTSIQEQKLLLARNHKEQMNKSIQQNTQVSKQNKLIKIQVGKIQQKMKIIIQGLQNKNNELQKQNQILSSNYQKGVTEKEHFKKMFENIKNQSLFQKQKNNKLQKQNQQYHSLISDCQNQIECLKEEILNIQLSSGQKDQLQKLRSEHIDIRAKTNHQAELITKYKQEIQSLTKDLISLNQQNFNLKTTRDRIDSDNKNVRNQINNLQSKNRQLQKSLKDRCNQLQSSMPYLNQVIQQKKMMQNQLQKMLTQIKKKENLLQIAKKSKAQEIISLRDQVKELSQRLKKREDYSKQSTQLVQKMNRQKVINIRELTIKNDEVKKLQEQVKRLQEQVKGVTALLRESEKLNKDQGDQIQHLYKIMDSLDESQ